MKTQLGYKIPGRQVYCETLRQWIAETILIYVVYKLAPPPISSEGTARLKRVCRWLIRKLARPGTVVLSFCWNTASMGPGWELAEVLIVDHGGDHNATLCRAEIFTGHF